MRRAQLFALFEQARRLSQHREFVVVGSLSILGLQDEGDLPPGMCMSTDIDSYTRADPGRIFDLRPALGEGSDFHRLHGFFLDPVSPDLPTLPEGWEDRFTVLEQDGLRLCFLDPDDAAVSKYTRGDANDYRWIRAGLISGHLNLPKIQSRLSSTVFLDDQEETRVRKQVKLDRDWFEGIKAQRKTHSSRGQRPAGRQA